MEKKNNMIKFLLKIYHFFFPKKLVEGNQISKYPVYYPNSFDLDIFRDLNTYRRSKGLKELLPSLLCCNDIAAHHAKWLSDNATTTEELIEYGHYYFQNRVNDIHSLYSGAKVGECVAYGYNTSKGLVSSLINSKSHNEIITGDFTHVAIASENKYVVTLFIKLN